VVEDFPGNYSDLEPMKTVQRLHKKEENKAEKKDWKQNNPTGNLTFNEQKNIKIEKEGFRSSKLHSSNCSRTKKTG
jgi:ATP-binding cassette subfamily F protein uup